MSNDTTAPSTTRDVVVMRTLNAPVEQVWRAWSDAEQVKRWWGPTGFTAPVAEMDFREGGTSLVCMRSPDGQDYYSQWHYRSIVPHERIEFVQNFADAQGNRIAPADAGLPPDIPQDVRQVVTLQAVGDHQTAMTVTEYGYTSDFIHDLSKAGMEQCIDKMATALADD